ncbi:MAG: fibronectin type III-like domain-contianing protein, partial [Bacillota bacterium]
VVQVYVKDHNSPFAVKNHSLCAFMRVKLAAGQKAYVTLPIPAKAFQAVGEDGKPTGIGKRFTLFVGGSQPDRRSVSLTGQKPLEVKIDI